jgi:tRNA1Val (adenine37-N6)-methyltransferase
MSRTLAGASFDLVVSNPPYQARGNGPANPDDEAAIARHELRLTLADLVREARRLLAPGGRAAFIYPVDRLPALLGTLEAEGLRSLRVRPVYPRPGQPARRVLVAAHKGARGPLVLEPPLYVLGDDGAYTPEARRALGEPV